MTDDTTPFALANNREQLQEAMFKLCILLAERDYRGMDLWLSIPEPSWIINEALQHLQRDGRIWHDGYRWKLVVYK